MVSKVKLLEISKSIGNTVMIRIKDIFLRPHLIFTKWLFHMVLYECKCFYTCLYRIKWTSSINSVSRTRTENNRCLWYKDKLNTSSLELTNKKLHWIKFFVPTKTLRFLDYDIFQGFSFPSTRIYVLWTKGCYKKYVLRTKDLCIIHKVLSNIVISAFQYILINSNLEFEERYAMDFLIFL